MTASDAASDRPDQPDHEAEGSDPDALPSGAGPQAEGDQSDISSGGGTDE